MLTPYIVLVFATADETIVLSNIGANKTKMDFLINLTPENRKKLRKTGTKREGYVKDVFDTATANPDTLPADFEMSDWIKVRTLRQQLINVRDVNNSFTESLDDTILLLGSEDITFADGAYGHLKQSAKANSALTISTERIAKTFIGQGRETKKTIFNVNANSQVVVSDVSVSTKFLNTGGTPLQIVAGSAIGKYIPQTVAPGATFKLDKSYKSITVINQTAVAGEFSVKLKPGKA